MESPVGRIFKYQLISSTATTSAIETSRTRLAHVDFAARCSIKIHRNDEVHPSHASFLSQVFSIKFYKNIRFKNCARSRRQIYARVVGLIPCHHVHIYYIIFRFIFYSFFDTRMHAKFLTRIIIALIFNHISRMLFMHMNIYY